MSMQIRSTAKELEAQREARARREAEEAARKAAEIEKAQAEEARLNDAWSTGGWLSVIVYYDFEPVADILRQRGATACAQINDTTNTSSAYAFVLGNVAWLVFRGTNDVNDWAKNLLCRPGRHYGFERCFRDLQPGVDQWLDANLAEGMRVAFAGHSLGGALAILAAEHVNARGLPIEAVSTFGAPRVLPDRRAWAFAAAESDPSEGSKRPIADVTMRYVDQDELVSRVPPALIGFDHVGQLTMLGFRERSGWWSTFVDSLKNAMGIGVFVRIVQFYVLMVRAIARMGPAHNSEQYARRAGPNDPLDLEQYATRKKSAHPLDFERKLSESSLLSKNAVSPTKTKVSSMLILAVAVALLLAAAAALIGFLGWVIWTTNWEAILALVPPALVVAYLDAKAANKGPIVR